MKLRSTTRASLLVICVLLTASGFAQTRAPVRIDAALEGQLINRALFSITNYQYLFANGNGKALEQFADLGPAGMQQRIEARFSDAEPTNDNDDPNILDAEQFLEERLLVSVTDPVRFLSEVDELGMDVVLLLGYNAPWLSADGRLTGAPTNIAEWVEFARSAVQTVVDAGGAPVRFVEVWNEPNIEQFFTGDREEYFELFNAVADELHSQFPGINVGGPVLSPGGPMDSWVDGFIERCGERADFLSYHSYGQRVAQIIADIERYGRQFRASTGKSGPRILITESDHRIAPKPKFAYLVERQLALLEVGEELLGFHHFTLPYYEEGAFVFGLIHTDAGIVGENYWPYWLFRNFTGRQLELDPDIAAGVRLVASTDDGALNVIAYNGSGASILLPLDLMLPDAQDRVATGFIVDHTGPTLAVNEPISGDRYQGEIALPSGSALTMQLAPREEADPVFVRIEVDRDSVLVGESVTGTITLTNLLDVEIRGKLMFVGNPQDWRINGTGDDGFYPLAPGESISYEAQLETTSPTELGGAAVYGLASFRKPRTRSIRIGSAPVRVEALAPLTLQAKPLQVWARPGDSAEVVVAAANTYNQPISGAIDLELPDGWNSGPVGEYELATGESRDYVADVDVPVGAAEGEYSGHVYFDYQGNRFVTEFTVSVREYVEQQSTPVDLSGFYNSDLFTAPDDFSDVANFGGPFSYPVRFFPSNERVEYLGVQFNFPNTATGNANGVRSAGQLVPVPEGGYSRVYFLSAATNGDKTALVTLHYADGSSETFDPVITDWCVDSRNPGEIEIAKAPYRHLTNGVLRDARPRIHYHSIPAEPEKTLVRVELPPERDYWIIAMTLTK